MTFPMLVDRVCHLLADKEQVGRAMKFLDSSGCVPGELEIDPSDQVSPVNACTLEYLHYLAHVFVNLVSFAFVTGRNSARYLFRSCTDRPYHFARWECARKIPSDDNPVTVWA